MKLIVLVMAAGAVLSAQTPARDAPANPTSGSALISGHVVTADEPARPVRQARVLLTSAGLRRQPMAMTDTNGRFVFRQLPAGRFTLSVSKPGFIAYTYGAKRAGGAGVPIVLGDGEQADVTATLTRGAVIAGTIRGADGEPAANVRVQVLAYDIDTNGARTLQTRTFSNSGNGTLMTDDRGAYRIYGLRSGEYYVQASTSTSGIGGRSLSVTELDWVLRAIASPSAPLTPAPPQGQSMTLAPVLYPGTSDPAAAVAINLAAGEERTGVDFTLSYTPTATLTGIIRGPDGSPPTLAQASLIRPTLIGSNLALSSGGGSLFIRPDPEGRFTVANVVPGEYVLAARGSMDSTPGSAPGPMAVASMPLWALMEISVSGRDINGLDVKLAAGINISGRLAFDGANTPPPTDLSKVSISLLPQGATSMGAPAVVAKADGTFILSGVGPGDYRLTASVPSGTSPTSPWTLRSAVVRGSDTIDRSFDVRTEDVGGVVITFTDRPTELSGALLDAAGRPAPEFFIVIFPTDRSLWAPQSRRIRSARPGNTGNFRITGFPPGEYYICALSDLEQNQLNTPAYLEQLVSGSFKLTFAEGEKKTQDLKIAR
jgi:carboxypeptidase family protein